MPLRKAQRGYRYQDFMSARIVLSRMLSQGNPIVRIDEKETKNDIVDDIKIITTDKKVCYQIKYTTNDKALSWTDIADSGQLDLKKLYNHFQNEPSVVEYVFILKWKQPANDDKIYQYICNEDSISLIFENTFNYRLQTNKYLDIADEFDLAYDDKLKSFFDSVHFICNAPNSSLDISNPMSLEYQLISLSKQLGIGVFPNEKQSPENFIIRLVDELTYKRSADVFEININDLLQKLGIVTDFGAISQCFQLNEEIFLSQSDKVDNLLSCVNDSNKILLTGEPGSGKSYLINELINKMQKLNMKYCHHYFFVGNADQFAENRINKNIVIANLLNEIYANFPELNNDSLHKLGATIEILNAAISKIEERFYVVIDGIDHAYRNYYRSPVQNEIMEVLSSIITTDYVKILFVSQPIENLNNMIGAKEIFIQSWNQQEIKEFLPKFGLVLNEESLNKIVDISNGNPLYLTYILNALKQGNFLIDELPKYTNNISDYYSYLITKINDNELFELIATIPFLFERNEIVEISNRGKFALSKLNELIPILHYDKLRGGYKVYHESLKRFIYDFCNEQQIDLKEVKIKILNWLKKQNFYANQKSYNYIFPLAYELEEYEFISSYLEYEFLNKSIYYGNSRKSISKNLNFVLQSICKLQNLEKLFKYMLVDRIMQQHQGEDFLTSNESEFFEAYISLFGQSGANELIYRRQIGSKALNNLLYNAASMGMAIPWEMSNNSEKYSEYEDDINVKLYFRKKLIDGIDLSKIEHELSFEFARYLLEEAVSIGEEKQIRDALKNGFENCNNIKLLANALCFGNYNISEVTFDFNEPFDEKDRGLIYKRIIDFISFCDSNLQNKEVVEKLDINAESGFLWGFLRYVYNLKKIYSQCNSDRELNDSAQELINNLQKFVCVSQPFNGHPRACDLTDTNFRAILLAQLFVPIRDIKNNEFQKEYLNLILLLYNKIATSFRGSKSGCLLFFEIMNKSEFIITKQNYSIIFEIFNKQIDDEKTYSSYDYIASYYFKLTYLLYSYDIEKAKYYYNKGINYTFTYGFHRDGFLFEVLNAFEVVKNKLVNKKDIFVELGNMAFAMFDRTDSKDTKHLPNNWFSKLSDEDVIGALEFLASKQIGGQYDWRFNRMSADIVKKTRGKISDKLYYYLLICNQFENNDFDYNFYIKFVEELYASDKIDMANNLLSYMCSLPEKNICLSEKLVESIKSIAKDHNVSIPDFEYCSSDPLPHVDNQKQKLNNYNVNNFVNEDKVVRCSTPQSVIQTIVSLDFDDLIKRRIINCFNNEIRFENELYEDYFNEIEKNEMSNDKKVFLYMCIYVILTDGWYDTFNYSDFAKKAFELNQKLAKEYFFEIISVYSNNLYRGMDNLIKTLSILNFEDNVLTDIWEDIIYFAKLRLPDINRYVEEQDVKSKNKIEVQVSKMILSNLSDYTSDNHKRILRFIFDCILGDATLEKPVLQYVFENWEKLNCTTKIELCSLFNYSDTDFSNYVTECEKVIENDTNIMSKLFLMNKLNKEKNVIANEKVDLNFEELNSISEDEMSYCKMHLFNFNLVHQFCNFYNIDSRKIICIYKKLRKEENKSDTFGSLCSSMTKHILDNYISYDIFLNAVNIVLSEAYMQEQIDNSDIANFAISIMPELYSMIGSFDSAILNDDSIVLALYSLEEDENSNEFGVSKKHIKYEFACIKDNDEVDVPIVMNNISELYKILSYEHQLFFMLDPYILYCLGLYQDIDKSGNLCAKDNEGNIAIKYVISKSKLHGIEYFQDKYYKHEEGRLLITKEYALELKKYLECDFYMISQEITV